jgi:hypothetical protein
VHTQTGALAPLRRKPAPRDISALPHTWLTSYAESDLGENLRNRPYVLSVDLTAARRKLIPGHEIRMDFRSVIAVWTRLPSLLGPSSRPAFVLELSEEVDLVVAKGEVT